MKQVSGSVQEWLIAIALFIVIPTAVYLGVKLISPSIDRRDYHMQKHEYFKEFQGEKKHDQINAEWEKSEIYLDHKEKECATTFNQLIIAGPLSCALFFAGSVFVMPIVSASLLLTASVLMGAAAVSNMSLWWPSERCAPFHGIEWLWIELFLLIISFLIVAYFAYQSSEKNIMIKNNKSF